jgi:multidrug resistance protein MdtO
MARVVAERVTGASELVRLIFEPAPGRVEFALRVGAICAATTLVGEVYRAPPDLALAVYVVFFMNKADRATSVVLGFVMPIVMTICVLVVLGVALQVMDHQAWKVASIAILSMAFLFLGSTSAVGPLGGIFALVTGYALDTLTQLPVGDLAARGLLYAWLLVALPALLSNLFNLMMAPSPRQLVQRDLAAGLRLAAKLLTDPDPVARRSARERLPRDAEEIPKLLELVKKERVTSAKDTAALRQAALSATSILALAELADRDPDARPPAPVLAPFAATLAEMAAIVAGGGYPLEIEAPDPDVTSLSPRAAAMIVELRALLGSFADPPLAEAAGPAKKARHGFFRADALTNPQHIEQALRTTAAAMTCYLLYTLLHWNKIHTCFITCYVVSLGTIGDSIQKLALRIAGCLVGAAAGLGALIAVIPHLSSIPELLAAVFLGTFVSAWVAGGSKRISYAGFQMAFAFLLCVIQRSAPGTDMVTARDRIWGIVLGNAASYVFFTRLWPVSVGQRIGKTIVLALRRLRDLSGSRNRHEGLAVAGRVHVDLAGIEEDLVLARLEPLSIRPDAAWIARQERARDEIGALCEILVIGAGTATRGGAAVGERLDELADAVEGRAHPPDRAAIEEDLAARGGGLPAWEPFRSAVEAGLRHLEDELAARGEVRADALPAER